jgi:hypothetical protein
MIYINNYTANSSLQDGSYVFVDFYTNSPEKIACFFHIRKIPEHPDSNEIIKEAFAVLQETFEENFYSGYSSIEERLRKATKEMHWHLAAFFNRKDIRFEISCVLLVIHSSKIYVVKRGRLAMGILSKDSVEFIGLDLKQIYERKSENSILGLKEGDIRVDIIEKEPVQGGSLFILPASHLVHMNSSEPPQLQQSLASIFKQGNAPYLKFDFAVINPLKHSRRKRITARVSAITLAIIVIAAAGYGIFGKKWSQSTLSSGKAYMDEKKTLLLNHTLLPISQSPTFVEDAKFQWSISLTPTLEPFFDTDSFYLISDNIVTCYKKSNREKKWQNALPHNITEIHLLRNDQILLIDSQGTQYLLQKQDGKVPWNREAIVPIISNKTSPHIIVIDYIRDGRLEKNYYVTANNNTLSLVSIDAGEIVAQKIFQNPIDFISEYNYIDKCLYLVTGEEIRKINIELR